MTCRECGQYCHCGRFYTDHRCACSTFVPEPQLPPVPVDVCPRCFRHVSDPAHTKCLEAQP